MNIENARFLLIISATIFECLRQITIIGKTSYVFPYAYCANASGFNTIERTQVAKTGYSTISK